jgi:hypothetical protein
MNEGDIVNKALQMGIRMAGNAMPGWDNVFIPLGFVMSAMGAFYMYTVEEEVLDKKAGRPAYTPPVMETGEVEDFYFDVDSEPSEPEPDFF